MGAVGGLEEGGELVGAFREFCGEGKGRLGGIGFAFSDFFPVEEEVAGLDVEGAGGGGAEGLGGAGDLLADGSGGIEGESGDEGVSGEVEGVFSGFGDFELPVGGAVFVDAGELSFADVLLVPGDGGGAAGSDEIVRGEAERFGVLTEVEGGAFGEGILHAGPPFFIAGAHRFDTLGVFFGDVLFLAGILRELIELFAI